MERSPAVIAELAWKCLKGRFRRICEAIFEGDACESAFELFAAPEACVVVLHSLPPIVIDLDGRFLIIEAYDEVLTECLCEVEELKRIHEVDVHIVILNGRFGEL